VDARNSKGDVELTLPPTASDSVNAHTHNGDIVSDYPLPSMEGDDKTANFQIGSGGTRVTLNSENGDIRIKKGSAVPPPPALGEASSAPETPKAPHLKAPKPIPPQPVTQ
jgi:hypothetical protein